MIIWGGHGSTSWNIASGAVYNPRSDTWRVLPKSPLSAREGAFAVWTGAQVVFFGGTAGQSGGQFTDGAAYDPNANRWTILPAAPLQKPAEPSQGVGSPRIITTAVWTGREVIFWGGNGPALPGVKTNPANGADWSAYEDGEAYNPVTQQWRKVAAAPMKDLANGYGSTTLAVWNGRAMIAIQANQRARGGYEPHAAAYDPASDTWVLIAEPPASCCAAVVFDVAASSSPVIGLVQDRPLIYLS